MLTPARILGMVLAATMLSGCGLRAMWSDVPPPPPVHTPAPNPPDERTLHPYTGELAANTDCRTVSKDVLGLLQDAGNVGGAVTYSQGVAVRSNAKWWTVAVRTAVDPYGDIKRDDVPAFAYLATNLFTSDAEKSLDDDWSWLVDGGTPSAEAALTCLKKLPAPKVLVKKPPKPASPDDTYNGRPARGAACHKVSTALLDRLQEVGQVGGAITYPRGQMVRANRTWWTVAVATQVNPNSLGYTTDSVPSVVYFVTNEPSLGGSASGVFTFPIKGKDRASARATACLK
ncbi:MAG TPA: hypothetical protein VGK18_09165 [Propionicimonas sp.]|uniref:hypothetical protein n=1 Tax=Propionicimonas sp. TaxID=1955623 RepID=UPI002F40C354